MKTGLVNSGALRLDRRTSLAACCAIAALLIAGCGGGSGSTSTAAGAYSMTGRVQKGPFGIGSEITVNALSSNLTATGAVFNSQTTDSLGDFSVAAVTTPQVEIVAEGFYFDEIGGQLSASQIQLRSITDLTTNTTPTVNILTTLQEQRIKTLVSQGSTLAAAATQSQSEVLALFGISASTINSLSTSDSMRIDGSSDEDAVLLAISVILAQMATDTAKANGTTEAAELSNLVNTVAAGIASSGTMTSSTFTTAKDVANAEISASSVTTNLQTYYAKNGATVTPPAFIEWVDRSNSGVLPQRLVAVSGVTLSTVSNATPGQSETSNSVTVSGVAAGVVVPVAVPTGVTVIKNGVALSGLYATAQEGDTLAFQVSASGYGISDTITVSVGSSTASWVVSSPALSGSVTGLTGTGLVLQVNGTGNVAVSAGSSGFSFPSQLAVGTTYNVTVLTQPSSPLQSCVVSGGSGTVGTTTAQIAVTCGGVELVYVANSVSATISEFQLNTGTGTLSSVGSVQAGSYTLGVAATSNGKFVYVTCPDTGATPGFIREFAISPGTGALSLVGTVSSTGFFPYRLRVDATNSYLYVVNENSGQVAEFSIDSSSGGLTSIGTAAVGSTALDITLSPNNQFAYVTNDDIQVFGITAGSGLLTTGPTISPTTGATVGVVTPNGQFAYFTAGGLSSIVNVFSVDPGTGNLTLSSTYTTGLELPRGVAVDPSGSYLYVANGNNDTISELAIDPTTGALSSIGSVAIGTDYEPDLQSLEFDPSGNFLLADDPAANTISTFRFDSTTGQLSLVATAPTGTTPISIAVVAAP